MLITELKEKVKEFKLIPGTGGAFEIEVNGDLIDSKLKTGQFPDENWVLDTVRKKASEHRLRIVDCGLRIPIRNPAGHPS